MPPFRYVQMMSQNAERRTQNAERRTQNAERRTCFVIIINNWRTGLLRLLFILQALVLLTSCSESPTLSVVHLSGQTMGTTYNVKYVVANQDEVISGLQEALDKRLFEINKLMSTYDTTSELSRFNQYRYTNEYAISAETHEVLEEAIRLGKLSNNVLDITVGPLVNLWGFGPTKRPEVTPSEAELAEVRQYIGLDKIQVNGNTISKSHPLVYVDLSTIAKGYAVDELARMMEARKVANYLVEIGGEMRVKGERGDGSQWLIAIEKPVSSERAIQKIVSIGDNAIATSGDYRNYYEQDGVRYSHLIDPRTGKPIQHNLVATTVVHPSSMTADGLATALMILGWDESIKLAEQNNLAVFLIKKTDTGFEEYASPQFDATVKIKQ